MSNSRAMEHDKPARRVFTQKDIEDLERLEARMEAAYIQEAVAEVFLKRNVKHYTLAYLKDGGITVSRNKSDQCEPLVHTQKR